MQDEIISNEQRNVEEGVTLSSVIFKERDVEARAGISARAGPDKTEGHLIGQLSPFSWADIVNGGMQTVALIVAVAFGVWAIKSYDAALDANKLAQNSLQLSLLANQIALISFCGAIGQIMIHTLVPSYSKRLILNDLGMPTYLLSIPRQQPPGRRQHGQVCPRQLLL